MIQSNALKTVSLVAATAAATLFLIQACGGGATAQTADTDPIVGVWDSIASVKDCSSGAVVSSFRGLSVAHQGGTLSADSSRPPTTRGAAFGTWRHESGNTYRITLIFLRFAPDQSLAGIAKVRGVRVLAADGNSFTTEVTSELIDTAGVVVQQTCTSDVGQRVSWS